MPYLGIRRAAAVATLIVLGAAALAGCASPPTAIEPARSAAEARVPDAGGGPGPGGLVGGAPVDLPGITPSLQKTVENVSGTDGGTVRAGRFSVKVPPGAVEGVGEISVTVPDSMVLRVDLHIVNAPNAFKVPVTLEVSYAGVDGSPDADPAYYKIFWFDEDARAWRMLPTEVDLERQTVSTRLEHFSTYGVLEAKAGW